MKNVIAITIALVALLLSLSTLAFQLKSKPLGEGIEKYSFAEPLEAYKSILQMKMNKDILAQIQLDAAINGRKIKEQLETIKVHKTREHGGKTILFIESNDAGLPKKKVVSMEKDAGSGFWHEVYTSAYEMEEKNPALAVEMGEWEK
ncbi:MAG: hypothetical protein C4518_16445 [Desulfobacteraceae bacterium]|nr:MAG: hypothetical protein C4518_16445 [Desulfobacteraceae bacterium]